MFSSILDLCPLDASNVMSLPPCSPHPPPPCAPAQLWQPDMPPDCPMSWFELFWTALFSLYLTLRVYFFRGPSHTPVYPGLSLAVGLNSDFSPILGCAPSPLYLNYPILGFSDFLHSWTSKCLKRTNESKCWAYFFELPFFSGIFVPSGPHCLSSSPVPPDRFVFVFLLIYFERAYIFCMYWVR